MGHYTAFGVAGRVEPRYRDLVHRWITGTPTENCYDQLYKLVFASWTDGELYFDGIIAPAILRDLQEYMKDSRSDYIPFGKVEQSLAGFRGDWVHVRHCDVVTGWLVFTCALKNSDQTIEKWLRLVGRHLIESYEVVQVEYDPDTLRVGANIVVTKETAVLTDWHESEAGFYGHASPSSDFPHPFFREGIPTLQEQP